MDPNTARRVLRLDPVAPLTAEAVEAAFARESWERHPSRYPDAPGAQAATAWAATLAQARAALLVSTAPASVGAWALPSTPAGGASVGAWAPPSAPAVVAPSEPPMPGSIPPGAGPDPGPRAAAARAPRRRAGLITGIVAAGAGVLALIGGAAFGATKLAEQVIGDASQVADEPWFTGETVHYSADETLFTFPAALEEYYDGRYTARCPADLDYGCWEWGVIAEAACASLEVDVEYAAEETAWTGDDRETLSFSDVAAGGVTPLVFGHNEYEWAWVADVRCLDALPTAPSGPSTTGSAVSTPLARGEAGHWNSADTGFSFPAALEFYDDGRLDAWCADGFERGCWQAAIIPEDRCGNLRIEYTLRAADGSEVTDETWRLTVDGEPVEVVFGNDAYDSAWISRVDCMT
ncbi:hypothetical protein ACFPER_17870 [Agromyces aurantiacus]|uniref:J domain-containing protein n=1 Tax=Agromyces aurantiacus TaxID=165814 RepID=A0ABV9REU8_9MICO|nr:hypothetical protein [Agromyces aurantiacus]MBM7505358.1 hypothetical protein [Agromyces aurantiacus]